MAGSANHWIDASGLEAVNQSGPDQQFIIVQLVKRKLAIHMFRNPVKYIGSGRCRNGFLNALTHEITDPHGLV